MEERVAAAIKKAGMDWLDSDANKIFSQRFADMDMRVLAAAALKEFHRVLTETVP